MPLTLEQYARYLDTRDLAWPAPPQVSKPKARPHLRVLSNVKAVLWNVYGTLLSISEGELVFEHPNELVMNVALDKTLSEYKMWSSMSRKPGQPAAYLKQLYDRALLEHRSITTGPERYPELASERVWETILKMLLQKDYKFDAVFFGGLDEYSRKIAYFFHASMQGTTCYPGCAAALAHCRDYGVAQGLLGDGQCFTMLQLQRGLDGQQPGLKADDILPAELRILSHVIKARKPSPRLFQEALERLAQRGIEPEQVLHVGSSLVRDIAPARKLRMQTALFAGDKESLQASAGALRDPATRPDALITSLDQIASLLIS
jgi:FMN phosphatase YigB (HAD superfamily)